MGGTGEKGSEPVTERAAGGGAAPGCSIGRVEHALGILEGRWKLLIVHHLLVRQPRRFSELERAIPRVTQKMLIQQLRALEADGVVRRIVYPEVPPHVEYQLTPAGQALTTALDALHDWARDSCPTPAVRRPRVRRPAWPGPR
ncbi:winged helix-turn-helix transcriptional regulator [Actinacidiphila guanduensis]|uniref:Transcriptional regulator, HxlR family n=1 Tax=Actinacidiphila guanduensis TaxID=310781 RepID=A0A1H0LAZ7_9ACTN|nr:winged helix-turn-helix transcriptional regulator [Actinacidiphila guanduensis]SDO65414.1 transcriptional regulator, HxlR family [Actinacidiphila guanduensis]